MADKSRAEYFRNFRKNKKTFGALIDKDKAEIFEKILKNRKQSKREWLESKIDEEIGNSCK